MGIKEKSGVDRERWGLKRKVGWMDDFSHIRFLSPNKIPKSFITYAHLIHVAIELETSLQVRIVSIGRFCQSATSYGKHRLFTPPLKLYITWIHHSKSFTCGN